MQNVLYYLKDSEKMASFSFCFISDLHQPLQIFSALGLIIEEFYNPFWMLCPHNGQSDIQLIQHTGNLFRKNVQSKDVC